MSKRQRNAPLHRSTPLFRRKPPEQEERIHQSPTSIEESSIKPTKPTKSKQDVVPASVSDSGSHDEPPPAVTTSRLQNVSRIPILSGSFRESSTPALHSSIGGAKETRHPREKIGAKGKHRPRKKTSKQDDTPASDSDSGSDITSPSAARHARGAKVTPHPRRKIVAPASDSDSGSEDESPTVVKRSRRKQDEAPASDSDSGTEDESPPAVARSRKERRGASPPAVAQSAPGYVHFHVGSADESTPQTANISTARSPSRTVKTGAKVTPHPGRKMKQTTLISPPAVARSAPPGSRSPTQTADIGAKETQHPREKTSTAQSPARTTATSTRRSPARNAKTNTAQSPARSANASTSRSPARNAKTSTSRSPARNAKTKRRGVRDPPPEKKKKLKVPYIIPSGKMGMMPHKTLMSIKYYQSRSQLLLPRLSFSRIVREIMGKIDPQLRCTSQSLEALQESAEAFVVHYLSDSSLCSNHGKRVTLMVQDMKLVHELKHAESF